jgi:hypothetical protein
MPPKRTVPTEDIDSTPFPDGSLGPNTPKQGGSSTAEMWKHVKRLKPKSVRAQGLMLKGYTHVCIVEEEAEGDEGEQVIKPCHFPFGLTKSTGGSWVYTQAARHMKDEHPDGAIAKASVKRETEREGRRIAQQLELPNPAAKPGTEQGALNFKMAKADADISSRAGIVVHLLAAAHQQSSLRRRLLEEDDEASR